MGVVAALSGHGYQSQSRDHGIFYAFNVSQIIRIIERFQLPSEVPVCGADRISSTGLRCGL